MKGEYTKRSVFPAIALLALGAACQFSVAVAGADNANAAVSAEMSMSGARPIGVEGAPLTLVLQTPAGGTSRLTYVDKDGWRLDDREARLGPADARITPASVESQKEPSDAERPMTVFIDGPTGFTYVWTRDQGWKFVGQLSGRNQQAQR
jgi:hypothetical protein